MSRRNLVDQVQEQDTKSLTVKLVGLAVGGEFAEQIAIVLIASERSVDRTTSNMPLRVA